MPQLNIRRDDCQLDFLSLGAVVHRLDPGVLPFRRCRHVEIHVSGGEYNAAANLASCFGKQTGIATAMVDYGLGELVQTRIREMGVQPFYKHFEHDGVRGPNIATVYSDRGQGVRPPVVFYNRANEAGALLKPGDFDWKTIFAQGVRWFHSGGIFAALSSSTSELIIEAMQAASAAGAINSFDLNYRAKLWATLGGLEKGQEIFRNIVSHVDVLIGNEEDLQKGLGIAGPEVEDEKSELDPNKFFQMIDRVRNEFPKVKAVATTLRDVKSTNRHNWGAVLWLDGEQFVSPTLQLDVIDRIGGGDGFCSGLIFGLLEGRPPKRRSDSAGRTARCSRPFPGTSPWQNSTKWRRSPKEGRLACSDDNRAATVRERPENFAKKVILLANLELLRILWAGCP
ncbi:MAG: sugar kinase [Pirellulales bacterium]|nr:sugar kinase [Pirellulales bacterium]